MDFSVAVCFVSAAIALAAGAPFYPDYSLGTIEPMVPYYTQYNLQPVPFHLLQKRSGFGHGAPFVSPCAAAAGMSGYYANPHQLSHQHMHTGYQSYGHYPQYRENEDEMMAFSDMDPAMTEHMPMSRYAYGDPSSAHQGAEATGLSGMGHAYAPTMAGPAYGVFPDGHYGGCSIPLLFSCSPSVSQGKMMESPKGSAGGAPGGTAYRAAVEMSQMESESEQQEDQSEKKHLNQQDGGPTSGGVRQLVQ